ncbi:DUF305 domain-containing protein [Tropicibacter sp. R15_0]|uniref:DUF305 domain-containing protein n=1 Tax=Tropicibacter sp. R15_0 TaxID=2821101 RepID=UPI003369E048
MTLLMGATMAVVMLTFMMSMYKNTKANIAIFVGAILVFAASLWLVRGQFTVQDRSYTRAMIPHHSIAIMTSTHAEITDPRVRGLADDIIYAQDKEIAEMRYLIADISENGERSATESKAAIEVVDAARALETEVVSKVDPEFLTSEEIAAVFPDGRDCRYAYTSDSAPVLVTGQNGEASLAVMKISGDLVRLDSQNADTFTQGPLSAEIVPTNVDLTDLLVSAGADYAAGFRGLFNCGE